MEKSFGKYELIEKIGVGGMAEVFLAKSFGAEGLEKILVIKRILPEYTSNRRFVEMFISEAKIAMDLNHPNIVQIYDFGKVEQTYFLAMEFVDGADVAHIVSGGRKSGRPIALGDAIFLVAEIAKGLDYAHRRSDHFGSPLNIVHRDISPQNVLVSRDGTVKIVDFGIAKASSVSDENPHVVKGKFSYMSPEQASGWKVDHRSDIFSLGVLLFELVCGRPLFKHTTQEETLSLVKSAVVPDIRSLNEEIPEALEALLYRILAKQPDERPQSARDVQLELTKILYGLDEIHDSLTLATYLTGLEPYLEGKGDHQSTAVATGSLVRTVPGAQRTATGGTMVQTSNTPVTRIADEGVPDSHLRERKECVIVSGHVQGLFSLRQTLGQDRWLQVLQEYTRIVDSIAYKKEAIVHRVNEDGFTLIFGIPVSSENDAERAVRVSMDLHEAVAGMNPSLVSPLNLSIGLAMGDVVLEQEVDKTGRRFTWSFFGSSHELADRLARVAMAREILLGGQIFRRIKREFRCDKVDSLSYQEEEGATPLNVQAYRLIEPKSQEDKITEVRRAYHGFYGRELILKEVRERYRQIQLDKRAGAVVLQGGPGLGKSTLLEEFLKGLDDRAVRVLRGVVPPYERDVPLGAMAGLLSEMLRLGPRDDLRALRDALSIRINALFADENEAERGVIIHSVGSLFGIRFADSGFETLDPDERKNRIFLSIRKLLTRFAEKMPLVIAIDDAHHLDSMTVEFGVGFFNSTQAAPAVFVLALDPSFIEGEATWDELLAAKFVWTEALNELGESESELLVREVLKHHRIEDPKLEEEILRRSGGNPLFIKEVVEVLRDRGLLKAQADLSNGDGGHWIPSNVDGLIRARIDRLELNEKTALQRLALLWSPFTGAEAALVLDEDSLLEVQALVDRELLLMLDAQDAKSFEEQEFRFCNALTQDVAALGLVPEEAVELHRRLAKHLLESGESRALYSNALIARHFDGAGETDKSVEYYFEAAASALDQFGAAESIRLSEKVLERVPPQSKLYFDALSVKARALAELGNRDSLGDALRELEMLAKTRQDALGLAKVQLDLANFEFDQSELRRAKDWLEKVESTLADIDEPEILLELQTSVLLVLAQIRSSEGSRDEALSHVQEALESLKDGHLATNLVRAWNQLGVLHRQSGHHQRALEAFEKGLEVAQEQGLRRERRSLLSSLGVSLAYLGRFSQALAKYQAALDEARQLGHVREEAGLLINMGHAHLLRGATEEAVTITRRGNYLARKTNSHAVLADGLITLGACYVETQEWSKAEQSLHEGLRLADSIPNVYLSVHATLLLAQVNLSSGHSEQARIALMQAEDALERSEGAEMTWGIAASEMLMARAFKLLGQRDNAIEHSRRALGLIDDGEIYAMEEILFQHSQILPDEEEFQTERRQALTRSREVLLHRRDYLNDEEQKSLFMNRNINRQILSVAKVVLD